MNKTQCPDCGMRGVPLYRDRPKGQVASFVCVSCLPAGAPKPHPEILRLSQTLRDDNRVEQGGEDDAT